MSVLFALPTRELLRSSGCSMCMDAATLELFRRNKDEFFKTSPHSPLDPADQPGFSGLRYFPANPDLVFTVDLFPGDNTEVTIATSDGIERTYRRAGEVNLVIGGRDVRLTLFDTGHPGYFLPFRDATSGNQTYGAGRYLDLHSSDDTTVTVDFNLAYNPYCAYRSDFSCALPPADNWLTVPIEAGELAYEAPAADQ